MAGVAKQAGFSQVDFEACTNDQELYSQVNQTHDRAAEKFKVNGTPTVFVNGRQMSDEQSIEEFDNMLEPLLEWVGFQQAASSHRRERCLGKAARLTIQYPSVAFGGASPEDANEDLGGSLRQARKGFARSAM